MSKSDCMDLSAKTKATLYPRGKHRDTGYEYISGNDKRNKRYRIISQIKAGLRKLDIKPMATGKSPSMNATTLFISRTSKMVRLPIKNQAHHLLPVEFWDKMTLEQMKILSQIDYHIDNGEILSFYPKMSEDTLYISCLFIAGLTLNTLRLCLRVQIKPRKT